MNGFHTTDSEDSDALLNESLSEAETDKPSFAGDELRLARIDEYEHESLRNEDALTACLGGISSGLMRLLVKHEQAIAKAIDAADGNILNDAPLQRAMGTHVGLLRQVDRLANWEARRAKAQSQAENTKSQRRIGAVLR